MVKYLRIDTGEDFPDINQVPIGQNVFVIRSGSTQIQLVNMSNLNSFSESGDPTDQVRIPVIRLAGTGFNDETLSKVHEAIIKSLKSGWTKPVIDLILSPGQVINRVSVSNIQIPKPTTKN